jgi:SPP1 gp7 family putative phage head morphogenesis protein
MTIPEAVKEFRRKLLEVERETVRALLDDYAEVYARLLVELIEAMTPQPPLLPGEIFDPTARISALLREVEWEVSRWAQRAQERVERLRGMGFALGKAYAEAMLEESGLTAGFRTPLGGLVEIVSAQVRSPAISGLFASFGPQTAEAWRKAILGGIAAGRHPSEIAREVRRASSVPLSRAMRIARTEAQRAFRLATRERFEASTAVKGWVWVAQLDRRTCPACLAMHGTRHPNSELLDGHPNCRCVMVPIVEGAKVQVQRGEEWLRENEEYTEEILGRKWAEAWREGRVRLRDFVEERFDPLWGRMISARSPRKHR